MIKYISLFYNLSSLKDIPGMTTVLENKDDMEDILNNLSGMQKTSALDFYEWIILRNVAVIWNETAGNRGSNPGIDR
jgi:hypothetical protein